MSIQKNLQAIQEQIRRAEKTAGRRNGEVKLVAVSKTFPAEDVEECYRAGQLLFGENRVQEGLAKIPLVPTDAEWHLIGPLKKNKVRKAMLNFSVLHAVDSFKLAEFIDSTAEQLGITANILLEIHIGSEETKFGFEPDELRKKWAALLELRHLNIRGLMCIPPPVDRPEDSRPYFKTLRNLRDELASDKTPLTELSMGMSHDFEIAIQEGATYVRVGTAIFGGRDYSK